MTELEERLYKEYDALMGTPDYSIALYLLRARVAAGLENHETGSDEFPLSIGRAWLEASRHLDTLVRDNPREALVVGLQLSMLPKNAKSRVERITQWIRCDGPILLARSEIREPLLNFLENDPDASVVADTLRTYMCYRLYGLSKEEVFENPYCFLAVASMYLGIQLTGAEGRNAKGLFSSAKRRLEDRGVVKTIGYYRESEDTAWIADALLPKRRSKR
jgi:hypothetical protein